MQLRPYQQECINAIPEHGRYLIQMATGLGKTVTFSQIPRRGRMLILSHREELVRQPLKYFDCPTGIEMAGLSAPTNTEVISASVQTIIRRLDRFDPFGFDIVIVDECHHAASKTYRRILDYFAPRLVLGFTATPSRGDHVRLDDVFDDIIFQRDLRWGIENGYLSDIFCRRVQIGYDLSEVHTRHGDYAPGELEEAMDGTAEAIAEAYEKLATGATLIFAVSVKQAYEIAAKIPGAVAVTGETKDRATIIERFTRREIPCLVNCMVFTEGTDMPLIETVIIARPTRSATLYAQMVGRGLRLHPDKQQLNLIDCVDVSGRNDLCTAPSLLGIDLQTVPPKKAEELEGLLLELPDRAAELADCPQTWIKNIQIVNLWAKQQNLDTHGVNWFRMTDGSFHLALKDRRLIIPPMDQLGNTQTVWGETVPMQEAFDLAYEWLTAHAADSAPLWNLSAVKRWGKDPATENQLRLIRRQYPDFDTEKLTKGEAAMILNRMSVSWGWKKQ